MKAKHVFTTLGLALVMGEAETLAVRLTTVL